MDVRGFHADVSVYMWVFKRFTAVMMVVMVMANRMSKEVMTMGMDDASNGPREWNFIDTVYMEHLHCGFHHMNFLWMVMMMFRLNMYIDLSVVMIVNFRLMMMVMVFRNCYHSQMMVKSFVVVMNISMDMVVVIRYVKMMINMVWVDMVVDVSMMMVVGFSEWMRFKMWVA